MSSTSASQGLSYFTCTLSEAIHYNSTIHGVRDQATEEGTSYKHNEYQNISEFVDYLASTFGSHLAIGCVTPRKLADDRHDFTEELLTFEEVRVQTARLAQYFRTALGTRKDGINCVGLLASSSVIFLLGLLGLIRAGYKVLIVAPQNSVAAIQHLLASSGSFALCFDVDHRKDFREIVSQKELPFIESLELPWISLQGLRDAQLASHLDASISEEIAGSNDVAFFRHSSGTTGLPKLISQTHNGIVGVLPRLQTDSKPFNCAGTFTTTPLYHGGISDLFRSWSAAVPLWIFPEGKVPITGQTVHQCIRRIDALPVQGNVKLLHSQIGYLTCVPFVLATLAEKTELLNRMRHLHAVGVGGAAMPQDLGDRLVQDHVRLVSRLGSSECGFLLHSQREHNVEKDWQIFRLNQVGGLTFKPLGSNRFELVVEKTWPLVSTAAHAKRPYNTHDVFIPQGEGRALWRYVGRSDSQLTLSTGKKFDPSLIESALRECEWIEEVVVLGDDRPFAAAIIIASSILTNEQQQTIQARIQEVNRSNPSHARLSPSRTRILSATEQNRVRKNNKGAILRTAFTEEFAKEIESLYGIASANCDLPQPILIDDVPREIPTLVNDLFGTDQPLGLDDDFFEAGVDSATAIQVYGKICRLLPEMYQKQVPLNILYECGSIRAIQDFICQISKQSGKTSSGRSMDEEKHHEMDKMVKHHLHMQGQNLLALRKVVGEPERSFCNGPAVILTGCTGFLGSHVLRNLVNDADVTRVYLFIRGAKSVSCDEQQQRAKKRVIAALEYHGLYQGIQGRLWSKATLVPCSLKEPLFDLSKSLLTELVACTTHVIHAAWEVNFNLPLKSFGPQLAGTTNLFNLLAASSGEAACTTKKTPTLIFCSSVASIARVPQDSRIRYLFKLSDDPRNAANLGYAQSKWVAESVLGQLSNHTGPRISILRVGQLSGSTATGSWNRREAWPLMIDAGIKVVQTTSRIERPGVAKCDDITLPDLGRTALPLINWLPVDVAADSVHSHMNQVSATADRPLHVDHVANIDQATQCSWSQLQSWMRTWAADRGSRICFIDAAEWLNALESAEMEHQAKALIPLWRENWLSAGNREKIGVSLSSSLPVAQSQDVDASVSVNGNLITEQYFRRVLDWIAAVEA